MNIHTKAVQPTSRKRVFSHRCLSTHYSKLAPKMNVRSWVGKDEYLIRDDEGNVVKIHEKDINNLVQALINLRAKKMVKEHTN